MKIFLKSTNMLVYISMRRMKSLGNDECNKQKKKIRRE